MFWHHRPSDPKESPRLTTEEAALRDLEFDMRSRLQQERDARVETIGEVMRLIDVERQHREKQLDDVCKQLADRAAGAAASTGSAYARTLDCLGKVQEDVALSSRASKEGQQSLSSSLEQVLLQQSMQSKHLQQLSTRQEQVLIALESKAAKAELSQAPMAPAKQEKQQQQKDVAYSTEAVLTSLSRLEKQMEPLSRLDKLESKLECLHRLLEEKPSGRSRSQTSGETRGSDADFEAEFAGLWHDEKARHIITARHLRAQSGGKVELKVHSQRCFSVAGAPKGMGQAELSEDDQRLVWSSGRVWTRAAQTPSQDGSQVGHEHWPSHDHEVRIVKVADSRAGIVEPDDEGDSGHHNVRMGTPIETPLNVQRMESNGSDPSVSRKRRHALMQQDKAEEVRLAWLAQRGQIQTKDLTMVRSAVGDVLRNIGPRRGTASVAAGRLASYADWVEVQRRNRADERSRYIDRIVQSYIFEVVAAALILGNAVYIGYVANWFVQHPLEPPPESFGYVDIAFFLVFTVELLLRIVSLGKKFLFGPDSVWYALDAILLCVSGIEIAAGGSGGYAWLRTLRAFKLARVIRMVRTISFFKDLRLMMDCMMGSLVSLLWCLVLVVFMLYLFSLIFVQGFADIMAELITRVQTEDNVTVRLHGDDFEGEQVLKYIRQRYGSISRAMLRLWTSTTGGVDWQDEYFLVQLCGQYHAIVFLAFIAFMLIVVWNIVTSTIVEKALRYAQPDIDQLLMEKRRKDDEDVQMLCHMLEKESFDLNGKITKEGFVKLLEKKDVAEFLQARGIDIKEAHTFFALIGEEEGVDPVSFILSCLRIKGFATSIDLHTTHHQLMRVLQEQSHVLQELNLTWGRVPTLRSGMITPHYVLSAMSEVTDGGGNVRPRREPPTLSPPTRTSEHAPTTDYADDSIFKAV